MTTVMLWGTAPHRRNELLTMRDGKIERGMSSGSGRRGRRRKERNRSSGRRMNRLTVVMVVDTVADMVADMVVDTLVDTVVDTMADMMAGMVVDMVQVVGSPVRGGLSGTRAAIRGESADIRRWYMIRLTGVEETLWRNLSGSSPFFTSG